MQQKDSQYYLNLLELRKEAEKNQIKEVKTVLVVLNGRSIAFDLEALRYKIQSAYPQAKVYFQNTTGRPFSKEDEACPEYFDLLIDFTGRGDKQGWFYSRKLRKKARFAVGRNVGFFRKSIYDRVFDESSFSDLPKDFFERERFVQKKVMILAGVPVIPSASLLPDLASTIALELPPLRGEGA